MSSENESAAAASIETTLSDNHDLVSAIKSIRNGMSASEASRKYGVTSSRMYNAVKNMYMTPMGHPMNRTSIQWSSNDDSQENIVEPISSSESKSAKHFMTIPSNKRDIVLAIESVRHGMSVSEASRKFEVSPRLLSAIIKKIAAKSMDRTSIRRNGNDDNQENIVGPMSCSENENAALNDNRDVESVIECIRNGMSVSEARHKYGVSAIRLYDEVQKLVIRRRCNDDRQSAHNGDMPGRASPVAIHDVAVAIVDDDDTVVNDNIAVVDGDVAVADDDVAVADDDVAVVDDDGDDMVEGFVMLHL